MGRPRARETSKRFSILDMRVALDAKGYDTDEVLKTIKRYSKKELDISRTPASQPRAIWKIQRELGKQFTGIFEGDSGSALEDLVRHCILRMHCDSRCYRKATGQMPKNSSGDASDGDEEEDENDSDIEFVVVPAVTAEPPRQNSRMPVVASPASSIAATTSTSNCARASGSRFPSRSVPQPSLNTTSQPSTTHGDVILSRRPSLTRSHDVAAVERFLDDCLPSMAHFLERFISYGCRDPQFLLAVSTLPRDSIVKFIRSLPCLGGRNMSEMEVYLLTENFLRYSQ